MTRVHEKLTGPGGCAKFSPTALGPLALLLLMSLLPVSDVTSLGHAQEARPLKLEPKPSPHGHVMYSTWTWQQKWRLECSLGSPINWALGLTPLPGEKALLPGSHKCSMGSGRPWSKETKQMWFSAILHWQGGAKCRV
jgi:hypothetical protein